MKVLIADKFEKVGIDGLKELGCEVESPARTSTADDAARGAGAGAIPTSSIVRSTQGRRRGAQVRAPSLEPGDPGRRRHRHDRRRRRLEPRHLRLQLPGQELDRGGGAGDGAAAVLRPADPRPGRRPPGGHSGTRASTPRRAACTAARSASWAWARSAGRSWRGRRPSACDVVAWSRNLTHRRGRTGWASPTPRRRIEVARRADAVTINVAANGETKHLVNAEFLAAMKPGAYLINTSRGSVVDEAALRRGGRRRADIRAGLDVFQGEPGGATGEFAPERGEAAGRLRDPPRRRLHRPGAGGDRARGASGSCRQFLTPGSVPNCVNRLARSSATHVLSVRHHNRPGVLAHVFRVLADGAINVEEVENIIYHGATGDAGADPSRRRADRRRTWTAIRSGNSAHHQRRTRPERVTRSGIDS